MCFQSDSACVTDGHIVYFCGQYNYWRNQTPSDTVKSGFSLIQIPPAYICIPTKVAESILYYDWILPVLIFRTL